MAKKNDGWFFTKNIIDEINNVSEDLLSEEDARGTDQVTEHQESLAELQQTIQQLQTEKQHLQTELTMKEKQMRTSNEGGHEQEAQTAKLQAEKTQLVEENQQYQAQLTELHQEIEVLKASVQKEEATEGQDKNELSLQRANEALNEQVEKITVTVNQLKEEKQI